MMLYCYPELVHMDLIPEEAPPQFPPYDLFPGDPSWVPPSGNLISNSRDATREKGEILVEAFVGQVTRALEREFRS